MLIFFCLPIIRLLCEIQILPTHEWITVPTEVAVACFSDFSIITLMQNTAETTCFHLTFPCFVKDVNKALLSCFPPLSNRPSWLPRTLWSPPGDGRNTPRMWVSSPEGGGQGGGDYQVDSQVRNTHPVTTGEPAPLKWCEGEGVLALQCGAHKQTSKCGRFKE